MNEEICSFGSDSWGSRVTYNGGAYTVEDWFQGGPFMFVDEFSSKESAVECSKLFAELRP